MTLRIAICLFASACTRLGPPEVNSVPPPPTDVVVTHRYGLDAEMAGRRAKVTVTVQDQCRKAYYGTGERHTRRDRHPSRLARGLVSAAVLTSGVLAASLSEDEKVRIGGFLAVAAGATLVFPFVQGAIDSVPLGVHHAVEAEAFDKWNGSDAYDCGPERKAAGQAVRLTLGFATTKTTLYFTGKSDDDGEAYFGLGTIATLERSCGKASLTASVVDLAEGQVGDEPSKVVPETTSSAGTLKITGVTPTPIDNDTVAVELEAECLKSKEAACRATTNISNLQAECAPTCMTGSQYTLCSTRFGICTGSKESFTTEQCLTLAKSCAADEGLGQSFDACMSRCEREKLMSACP